MYACMYACIYVCMYACMYVCMYTLWYLNSLLLKVAIEIVNFPFEHVNVYQRVGPEHSHFLDMFTGKSSSEPLFGGVVGLYINLKLVRLSLEHFWKLSC